MKNDKEIVGTLLGFDDFVNMLLEDVTEYETTPEGRRITKLDQILLNGNNITMASCLLFKTWVSVQKENGTKLICLFQLVPGGDMPEWSLISLNLIL